MANLPSMRRRLLTLLLGATMLVWLATAIFAFFDAHHEIDELFDAQLAQSARVMLAQSSHALKHERHEGEEVEIDAGKGEHKYEQRIAFQIFDKDGKLLLRSASAPATRLSSRTSGYSDEYIDGEQWRIFSLSNDRGLLIQTGERHDMRNELAADVALRLAYPLIFALPVLALLIWFGVGRSLSPLRRFTREVMRRAPDDLARIDDTQIPLEIQPLADALNTLLERLAYTLENERRFTADASHELRTPLAALKIQAQVAMQTEEEEQRRHALRQVIEGSNRAAHLVDQLLTLARLDHAAAPPETPAELHAVAAECLTQMAAMAAGKNIELSLAEGCGHIGGDPAMLSVLVRNLVDNALRYTPPGGAVRVAVGDDGSRTVLEVCDSGPGIPADERAKVLERFHRIAGSEENGSGLGLSIVQRIADLHHAELTLGAPKNGQGLCVRVAFPRLAA
ncbi:MAG: sensor histidine kinase N-terminal domain-containing protein [Betaproteobacteria bacterium]|nr:sensor histidine kinase N-terminal domain-containing protein [Betaproteobacteria bacterium]